MKLTIFLFFLGLMSLTASTYSQTKKFSFELEKVTLSDLFKQIESQSEFVFIYKSDAVNLDQKVSVNFQDAPIDKILDNALQNLGLKYENAKKQIIITPDRTGTPLYDKEKVIDAAPQPTKKDLSGTVKDNKGLALPGVSVVIKGTATGTVTNNDGEFSLTVPLDSTILLFSFVGMKSREIAIGNNNIINITLAEETVGLDEVVAVGYGTQRKADLTGSIVQVNAKELKSAPITGDITTVLQGRLPGVVSVQQSGQPGSDAASLVVRGFSTTGDASPLLIVDGFPSRSYPAGTQIESITVLKDATSAAVYGVRAANGVILITTKRGTNEKPVVTLNSSVSLNFNTAFPKFLNGPDYVKWYDKAQELDGVPEGSRKFTPDQITRISTPGGDPAGVFGNTDWFGKLFGDFAPTYANNISINGGGEKVRAFVSLGHYNQKGNIARNTFERYDFRSNIDYKINDYLSVAFNIGGVQSERAEPGLRFFTQAMLVQPYVKAYGPNGEYISSEVPSQGQHNPLAARDLSGQRVNVNNALTTDINLKYTIPGIKGLDFKFNASYDKSYAVTKADILPYKLQRFNLATEDYTETWASHASDGKAFIQQWFSDGINTVLQPSVNYDNKFGKHSISLLVLYEYFKTKGSGMSAGKKDFPVTDIMEMSYGKEVTDYMVQGSRREGSRAGYVQRLNYNFDDTYLFQFTNRIDGSPRLPRTTRWGFFPGIAMGWRISNEPFFKNNVSFVNNLKLRASVGRLGNDDIGDYAYLRTAGLGASPVAMIGSSPVRALNINGVPNENIRWSTTTTWNAGFESTLWNGLLSVEGDIFYKLTENILQNVGGAYPASYGGYFPSTQNSGKMDNRGFEIILTHKNRIGHFNYSTKGHVSFAHNRILRYNEAQNVPSYARQTGNSWGLKYGFESEGLYQTQEEIDNSAVYGSRSEVLPGSVKLKDMNGDGRIDMMQDWTIIGKSVYPELMFGLTLEASYKGFDFNAFIQGGAIRDVALSGYYADRGYYAGTMYSDPFYSGGNAPYFLVEDSWRPDNTGAKYPRLSLRSRNASNWSSLIIVNGDYVRLKSLQLGYSLPTSLLKGVAGVRFYISGSNLFTLSHMPYMDPEAPDVNQGYYPQQKTYEFGVNVTF